jgi:hypothetical protein
MHNTTIKIHKPRRNPSEERATNLIFFFLCLAPLAASLFFSTNGTLCTFHLFGMAIPFRNICLFRLLTGYRCPVCGMTRCFTYLSHGNIAAAWQMSPAGVAVFALCVYETCYRFFRAVFGRFTHYNLFKFVEIALIGLTCTAVAFCFVAQFFIRL